MSNSKKLIEKINVSESALEYSLQWLSEGNNNALDEANLNPVVRYLLKKVIELESKIESYQGELKE